MDAPRRTAALLVAAALGLGACGQSAKDSTGDFKGDQKAVAQVVEDLQDESTKHTDESAQKICDDLLTPALVAKIKAASKQECGPALKDALGDADAFELQVQKVEISGTKATATVKSDAGDQSRTDRLALEKVGNAWKLASLG